MQSFDMPAIYGARREKLRQSMARKNLDALLISNDKNRFYLSGFELHDPQFDESAGRLIITRDGKDWLATDSRYKEAAKKLWPEDRTLIYGGDVARDIAALLQKLGARIGIEARATSLYFGACLQNEGRGISLEPADGLVEELRRIKEPCEIAALEHSFLLNHKLMHWVENEIAAGHMGGSAEQDFSWQIEKFFRENGAQDLAFANIVATGRNAAQPHAVPGTDVISSGAPLLIDVGCRAMDYCSDQTRTFWIGEKPAPVFARTLALVREAQENAMKIMRPGVPCAKVYAQALEVFKNAGVEKAFNHGLGHGVGLQTHEEPSLSPRSTQALEAGMTVTVEPGLYFPDWGGVRWEYTVLVEENGVRIL